MEATRITNGPFFLCLLALTLTSSASAQEPIYALGGLNASEKLGNYFIARAITESTPFQDFMGRATTTGQVFTQGRFRLDFVPSASNAIVAIQMTGTSRAPSNLTRQGQVRVYTSAATSIFAEKRINIVGNSIRLDPAQAECQTAIQINNVMANRRIVERLARRRSNRMRSDAEQRTSQRTEREISTRIDSEVQTMFSRFLKDFEFKVFRERMPEIQMASSSTNEIVRVRLAGTPPEGVKNAPILKLVKEADVSVFAHEELIEYVFESMFGGRTAKDRTFMEILNIATGSSPRQLWIHDRRPRWTIRLAKVKPVQLTFDNDGFIVTVKVSEAEYGDLRLKSPITLTATYEMEATKDGPHLIRNKDMVLQVQPEATPEDTQVAKHLLRKFDAFFKRDLYFDGLSPPAGGSGGKLRHLKLTNLRTQDQWFVITYRLIIPKNVPTNRVADEPAKNSADSG